MLGNYAARESGNDVVELAAIAEGVECLAWRDLAAAAPHWLRSETGISAQERDGALVLTAPGLDHVLFNRAIGLGERMPATDEQIAALIDNYERLGVDSYWIHAGPYAQPTRLGRQLQRHGLEPYRRSWVKMLGRVAPLPAPTTAACVRAAVADDAATIASIVGPAFDLSQRAAELFAALIDRPAWQIFIAEVGSEPIAAGGLYVGGETAYLAFAATRPEWRRHGAQQALIHARMQAAVHAGCRWMASETGFPLTADEPSPSYQNMLRVGLRPVAIRDNYAPAGTEWKRAA
jgi:hypothetical protein